MFRKPLSQECRLEIIELLQAGWKPSAIEGRTGHNRRTVQNVAYALRRGRLGGTSIPGVIVPEGYQPLSDPRKCEKCCRKVTFWPCLECSVAEGKRMGIEFQDFDSGCHEPDRGAFRPSEARKAAMCAVYRRRGNRLRKAEDQEPYEVPAVTGEQLRGAYYGNGHLGKV